MPFPLRDIVFDRVRIQTQILRFTHRYALNNHLINYHGKPFHFPFYTAGSFGDQVDSDLPLSLFNVSDQHSVAPITKMAITRMYDFGDSHII